MRKININYLIILISIFNLLNSTLLFCSDTEEDFPTKYVERLNDNSEHLKFLDWALSEDVKRKVLITSFLIKSDEISNNGTLNIIKSAKDNKKISFYIYADTKTKSEDIEVLSKHDFKPNIINNHSKCFMIDNEKIVIGSYNWLQNNTRINSSLLITGNEAERITDYVFRALKYYNSKEHNNFSGITKFLNNENNYFKPLCDQGIRLLITPEAHISYLNDAFKTAKEQIVIFSPYIHKDRMIEILQGQDCIRYLEEGKLLGVVTNKKPCGNENINNIIFDNLKNIKLNYPNFHYVVLDQGNEFHSKTLAIDSKWICEGSFNWLSALDDNNHDGSRLDISISIKNKELADSFYKAEFVRNVTEEFKKEIKEIESQKKMEKKTHPISKTWKERKYH